MSATKTPASPSRHGVALWAALTALFTNLAVVNLLTVIGADKPYAEAIAAVITAVFVAASIYTKQRWDDEKREARRRK